MRPNMKSFFISILITVLFFSLPCFAKFEQLIIEDTSGVTRAIAEISDKGNVAFSITDKKGVELDNIEILLTNSQSGDTKSVLSKNGLVEFQNLTPGTWTVASTVDGVTFTNVTITAGAGTIGGAGALAGNAAGIGILTGGDGVAASGAGIAGRIGTAKMIAAGAAATGGIAAASEIQKEIRNDTKTDNPLSPSS